MISTFAILLLDFGYFVFKVDVYLLNCLKGCTFKLSYLLIQLFMNFVWLFFKFSFRSL